MPKMMMKNCAKRDPPHPCDPPLPCDICDEGDECPKPSICVEKLKNPQEGYETRCKPGEWMPAEICKKPDPPHPCDPPKPCKPGKPRKLPCPDPPLCRERVNNPEDPYIVCPEPEDIYSEELCENLELLKTPIVPCPSKARKPCPKPKYTDPFDRAHIEVPEKPVVDPNEYLYSRELCKNMELLKQTIKSCFVKPCKPPTYVDPFGEIDPESKYPPKDDPCDEGLKKKKERLAKINKPCCDPTKPLYMGYKKPLDADKENSVTTDESKAPK